MNELVRRCTNPVVLKRALTVALVVGTALNAINHYEVFLGASPSGKVMAQMALTYMVPYLVSTHGQLTGTQGMRQSS